MNKQNENVIIIIPTYNEGDVITDTIQALLTETQHITDYDVGILIFDSASTDQGIAAVNRMIQQSDRLYLAQENKKTGLGSAYHQAMHYAMDTLRADIVIEFDADGSHQPKYIRPMLDAMHTNDVVIGSRYIKGGSIPSDWGWHRKLLSRLGNYVARLVLTTRYRDFTSGFRATRTTLLKRVLPSRFISSHYAYKLELFWLLHQAGASIKEIAIHFIDRKKGYSKLPTNSIIDSLYVTFMLRFIQIKRYVKMCMVGASGAIIHFTIYNLMRSYYSPLISVQFATAIAMLSNYYLNNHFTFKERDPGEGTLRLKRFSYYIAYSVVIVCGQSIWMHFALSHIARGRLAENVFLLVGMFFASLVSFQFYSRLIWPESPTLESS